MRNWIVLLLVVLSSVCEAESNGKREPVPGDCLRLILCS